MLARRLEADAGRRGVTARRIETVRGERPGTLLSVLVALDGEDTGAVAAFAASWTGTLCWQAPSPYRTVGRKNWYVTAQPCQVDAERIGFDESEVDVVACRTGGPGGQHRNKASTAVRATHRPTGTVVVVDTERHFALNRRIAMQLLRSRIAERDEAAGRELVAGRWRIHDELIRGNPTRVERP